MNARMRHNTISHPARLKTFTKLLLLGLLAPAALEAAKSGLWIARPACPAIHKPLKSKGEPLAARRPGASGLRKANAVWKIRENS